MSLTTLSSEAVGPNPDSNRREVILENLDLEPGFSYTIVPHAQRHAREGKFVLRVFAKEVSRGVYGRCCGQECSHTQSLGWDWD